MVKNLKVNIKCFLLLIYNFLFTSTNNTNPVIIYYRTSYIIFSYSNIYEVYNNIRNNIV